MDDFTEGHDVAVHANAAVCSCPCLDKRQNSDRKVETPLWLTFVGWNFT